MPKQSDAINLPSLALSIIRDVYIGSNGLSPFHACYANTDTVLRLATGRYFANYNGDDPVETYWALRKHAALCDVSERPVEITGPDMFAFLERFFPKKYLSLVNDMDGM